jgi:choline kinase
VLQGRPKCLLEMGGKSLIQRQIDAMKTVGVGEFVVVVGFEQQQIRSALAKIDGIFHFVENPIFARTNTLYSLWLTREFFDDDFIYFNGDILCDDRTVKMVASDPAHSQLACVVHPCGDEEVKVTVQKGRITEIGKEIDSAGCFGEFIGVARFARQDNRRFAEILDTCIKDESLWNRYFEYAVNALAAETTLLCADITGLPAVEIDFPQDLENARKAILPRLVQSNT